MKRLRKNLIAASCAVLMLTTSACTKDWWDRGQPPGTGDLLQRSSARLDEQLKERAIYRKDVANISEALRAALTKAVEHVQAGAKPAELAPLFDEAEKQLMALEGKLSVTSRAAYGELCGQFRRFHQLQRSGGNLEYPAFGLFTARLMFFLADELKVPAPTFS